MSKTKNWLMDMEEEFYDLSNKVIGECESYQEFAVKMSKHKDLMLGLYDENEIYDILSECWNEKWSKYL